MSEFNVDQEIVNQELKESFDKFISDSVDGESDSFKVTDDDSADWALSKCGEASEREKEVKEFAKMQIERIKEWEKVELAKTTYTFNYFAGLLTEYAFSLREKDHKFKSLNLPNGRFGFRKQQPAWEYDDDVVIKSLRDAALTDLINVKETVSKTDVKKKLAVVNGVVINPETGERIDGITVMERGEKFTVTAK